MAGEFRELLRERQPEALDRWLAAAKGSEAAELKGFAEGLIQDYEAVVAALTDALIVKAYAMSTPATRLVVLIGDVLSATDESRTR
jgi:hypothetical protein